MGKAKLRDLSYPIREQFDEEFDLSKLDPRNLPGRHQFGTPSVQEIHVSFAVIFRNGEGQ
jgi:hypothetical protein